MNCTAQAYHVSGDSDYFVYKSNDYIFVFPEEYESLLPSVIYYNEKLKKIYQREFDWKLDEATSLVLVSSRNQIPNAFATVIPNNHTAFYSAGMALSDSFANVDWLYTLLAHETAHLYQLNPKTKFTSMIKKVLGNNLFLFTPVAIPIFPQPNVFLPTYILEGNATFNESRFGIGGRMHSGPLRALVYSIIANGDYDYNRLINNHLDFPFLQEKYLIGAYMQGYLSERFGVDEANRYFSSHAKNFINPLWTSRSHKKHFVDKQGSHDARSLADWFFLETSKKARQQQSSSAKPFAKSLFFSPFNHTKNEVFFLINPDGRSFHRQVTLARKHSAETAGDPEIAFSANIRNEVSTLPFGKLFKVDGQYLSRSSQQYDYDNIRYSLYGEDAWLDRRFIDQFVFDRRAGKTLYVDAAQSFSKNPTYINGEFFKKITANAILSETGEPFHFQQEEREQVLYRGKERVGAFNGYFAKLLQVINNDVFFIGNTEFGSSLYSFNLEDRAFYRWSDSDTIVDARQLFKNQFIVCEVSGSGYHYKIIETQKKTSRPVDYNYHWEENATYKTFSTEDEVKLKEVAANANISAEKKKYLSIKELRYGFLNPVVVYNAFGGLGGYYTASFTDPLYNNNVSVTYSLLNHNVQDGLALYSNRTDRFNYYLGYLYDETGLVETRQDTEELIAKEFESRGFVGLRVPLFYYGLWTGALANEVSYQGTRFLSSRSEAYTAVTTLNFSWGRVYPLSFNFFRALSLTLAHKVTAEAPQWRAHDNAFAGFVSMNYDLGWENIFNFNFGGGFSENGAFSLDSDQQLQPTAFNVLKLSPGSSTDLDEIRLAGISYKKVLNWSAYSSVFPLGLRRFAPFAAINYYDTKEVKESQFADNFNEWALGVEFEFLLAHIFPLRYNFSQVWDDRNGDTNSQIRMQLNTHIDF